MADDTQYRVGRNRALVDLTALLEERNAIDLRLMKLKHVFMTLNLLVEVDYPPVTLPDLGSIHGKRKPPLKVSKRKRNGNIPTTR